MLSRSESDTVLTMALARLADRRTYSASRSAFIISMTPMSPTANALNARSGTNRINNFTTNGKRGLAPSLIFRIMAIARRSSSNDAPQRGQVLPACRARNVEIVAKSLFKTTRHLLTRSNASRSPDASWPYMAPVLISSKG